MKTRQIGKCEMGGRGANEKGMKLTGREKGKGLRILEEGTL